MALDKKYSNVFQVFSHHILSKDPIPEKCIPYLMFADVKKFRQRIFLFDYPFHRNKNKLSVEQGQIMQCSFYNAQKTTSEYLSVYLTTYCLFNPRSILIPFIYYICHI